MRLSCNNHIRSVPRYFGYSKELVVYLNFLFAYALTISLETILLCLLLRNQYSITLIIRNSIIASTLTLPFVWFTFPLLPLGWVTQTAFSELFAFGLESVVYKLLFERMSWKQALLVSFFCNLVSFGVGLIF